MAAKTHLSGMLKREKCLWILKVSFSIDSPRVVLVTFTTISTAKKSFFFPALTLLSVVIELIQLDDESCSHWMSHVYSSFIFFASFCFGLFSHVAFECHSNIIAIVVSVFYL